MGDHIADLQILKGYIFIDSKKPQKIWAPQNTIYRVYLVDVVTGS